jgi:hypothetical protein
VILGKFLSRVDLRQRRNRNFLGDDQGCLTQYPRIGCDTRVLNLVRRGDPKRHDTKFSTRVLYTWLEQSVVHVYTLWFVLMSRTVENQNSGFVMA